MTDMTEQTIASQAENTEVSPETSSQAPEVKSKKTLVEHRIDTTKMLIGALNDGKAPWQDPEAVEKIGLPVRSGRDDQTFKGFNAIVLMTTALTRNYSDPRWLTAKDAKDFGVLIKRGEKATYIETTDFYKRDENGKKVIEDGKPVILAKPNVYLTATFNVEQLEKTRNLERLPPAPEYKPKEPDLELAEKILKNSPVQLEHTLKPGDRPRYNGWTDVISMPPQESFATKEGYCAEVMHQLAHATGFSKRGNREGVTAAPKTKKNIEEELCGEMASLFLRLETGMKLESSHKKEHEDVGRFMEMNCLTEDGEVFNKAAFAIAATNAQRMTKMVLGLAQEKAQEKTQEKNAEQGPVQKDPQTRPIEQEKAPEQALEQAPREVAQENTPIPEQSVENTRKTKRGKNQEAGYGR
jgi:antirestriction protein ArdC